MTDLQRAHNDWLDPDSPRVGRRVEVSDEWREDRRLDERMEMMSVEDGGPAFPGIAIANPGEWATAPDGMSLRDYFAAKAMQAFIEFWVEDQTDEISGVRARAEWAYIEADAMLAERKKAKP